MKFKGVFLTAILTAVLCISGDLLAATYGGGSGTQADPYQIWTPDQMNTIGANSTDWGKTFNLMADIDMSIYTGTQYNIIGNSTTKFTGTFDGNGHIISNLTITASTQDCVGLFSYLGAGGLIKNLGVETVNITGNYWVGGLVGRNDSGSLTHCYTTGSVSGYSYVGGLVGWNYPGTITACYATGSIAGRGYIGGLVGYHSSGTITTCYATGTVSGTGSYVGGLVGGQGGGTLTACYASGSVSGTGSSIGGLVGDNGGSISNCYSSGSVSGSDQVGGLVGVGSGTLTACYASGSVSGTGSSVGGLVGNLVGMHSACFWNIQTSGQTASPGGKGLTTEQMKTMSVYQNAGWADQGWVINDSVDYPHLSWENTGGLPIPIAVIPFAGSGTVDNPYLISTAQEFALLSWYSDILNKHIQLTANLDLGDLTVYPIGDLGLFTGVFDGSGYTISNAVINQPSGYVGIFSRVGSGGQIKNMGVVDADLQGVYCVGGLVGENRGGTIIACYATGSVSGTGIYIGGLVGNNGGSISNCYSGGSVSGSDQVGGLVGYHSSGTITTCYATGTVSGTGNYIGGLVGNHHSGTLINCYATGSVSGIGYNVGGLVGHNRGSISNCYSSGSVSGSDQVGGLVGRNDSGSLTSCYSTGLVSGSGRVGGLVGINTDGSFNSCFWDTQTSDKTDGVGNQDPDPSGVKGKTTVEMNTRSTFINAGWDFVSTWWMLDGNYPYLISVSELSFTLYIQANPSFITSISPAVGQHTIYGVVNISTSTFSHCPEVYQFDHWEGDVDDPNSPQTTVIMDQDKIITAVFIDVRLCGDECHRNDLFGDYNHDCIIDIVDLAQFASNWLICTKPECD